MQVVEILLVDKKAHSFHMLSVNADDSLGIQESWTIVAM